MCANNVSCSFLAAPSEEPVPAPEPAPEPAPAYLRLLMETDWRQFCQEVEAFKQAAATLIANGSAMYVQLLDGRGGIGLGAGGGHPNHPNHS